MDIEKIFKGEGGYVFVSHSHLDIKTVREVRNFLEEKGLEPILFYLKSLDDSKSHKTEFLRSLIYDEIDAREFFLYLESQNAKASQWVQEEINYVREKAPEKVCVLQLEKGVDYLKQQLEILARRMRVFISYSRADRDLYFKLKKKLIECDFRVYGEEGVAFGGGWFDGTAATIKDISKEGTVIVLLSQASLRSDFVYMEVALAVREGGRIIPVVIDGDKTAEELPPKWRPMLAAAQYFTLPQNADEEQIAALVNKIAKTA